MTVTINFDDVRHPSAILALSSLKVIRSNRGFRESVEWTDSDTVNWAKMGIRPMDVKPGATLSTEHLYFEFALTKARQLYVSAWGASEESRRNRKRSLMESSITRFIVSELKVPLFRSISALLHADPETHDVETARGGLLYMNELVNNLSDFTPVLLSLPDFTRSLFCVQKDVIDPVCSILSYGISDPKIITTSDPSPMWVNSHALALKQVLIHVVEASVQRTATGHVKVYAKRLSDNRLAIVVEDTSRAKEGMEMGILRQLLERLDGHIRYDSDYRKGSRVVMEFRLATTSPPTSPSPGMVLGGATVLVVDDEPVVRKILVRKLKEITVNCAFIEVSTPEEAMGVCEKVHPDLAVVDYHLASSLKGSDLAAMMRNLGVGTLVGCSGSAVDFQNVDGFIPKPFTDSKTIAATIEKSIRMPEGKRALVVEDDAVNRAIIKRRLAQILPHASIDEAANENEAMDLITIEDYDLIFLDEVLGQNDKGSNISRYIHHLFPADPPGIVSISGVDVETRLFDLCWPKPLPSRNRMRSDLYTLLLSQKDYKRVRDASTNKSSI